MPSESVDPETLLRNAKRRKQTKEERLADVQRGREGRDKFGSKRGMREHGGTSNRVRYRVQWARPWELSTERLTFRAWMARCSHPPPRTPRLLALAQENLKNKLFTMVRYKRDVREKQMRSMHEKQVALRKAITKRKKQY